MAWLNLTMPNSTVKNGLKAKKIKLPQISFFLEFFFLKKFLEPIQSYEDVPFLAQNGPFVLNNIFLVQTIIIIFIYLLALFIVQNLKKFLQRI